MKKPRYKEKEIRLKKQPDRDRDTERQRNSQGGGQVEEHIERLCRQRERLLEGQIKVDK